MVIPGQHPPAPPPCGDQGDPPPEDGQSAAERDHDPQHAAPRAVCRSLDGGAGDAGPHVFGVQPRAQNMCFTVPTLKRFVQ